jgi:hypothetical protein
MFPRLLPKHSKVASLGRRLHTLGHRNVTIPLQTRWLTPNGTDFSEISRNTIRLARYLRNES